MMKLRTKINAIGFTVLELMIATTIFSTILLLCTYGLIQIGDTYYKGATTARTQEVARTIIDDISYEIQYGTIQPELLSGDVCIGPTRFKATLNTNVSGSNHALLYTKNGVGSCGSAGSMPADAKELLGENMRITKFSVTGFPTAASTPDYYVIVVNVVYGETDLADPIDPNVCKGGSGSQFCASAHLESSIRRRKS